MVAVCCMDDIASTMTESWSEAVVRHGSSPALHDYVTGDTYTYVQLDAVVQTVASRLRTCLLDGAARISDEEYEVGLVLCVAEGPAMVALVLSCAVSSLFYVPVDLAKTPPRRVSFTAADCGARALVAWRKDLPGYQPNGTALIAAEDLLAGCLGLPSQPESLQMSLVAPCLELPAIVRPSQALYAIYTSGSTGEPKGVMVEHSNMVAFAKAKACDERIGPGARVLLASTFTFDLCEGDLYASLMHGAALVLAPRDALLHDLATVMQRSEATHVTLTPSLFGLLNANRSPISKHSTRRGRSNSIEEINGFVEGPQDLPHLRSLSLGGEPMPRAVVTTWAEVSAQEQDARLAAMASDDATRASSIDMQQSNAEAVDGIVASDEKSSLGQPPSVATKSSPSELRPSARAGCVLRNIYGATEGTVHQCSQVMHRDTPANRVGKPLAPHAVVLVASWPDDDDDNEMSSSDSDNGSSSCSNGSSLEPTLVVPPWEVRSPHDSTDSKSSSSEEEGRVDLDASAVGEVTIVGATVARGYLHRPELNAAKFRSTPRLGRVYRTGDLARWVRMTPPPPLPSSNTLGNSTDSSGCSSDNIGVDPDPPSPPLPSSNTRETNGDSSSDSSGVDPDPSHGWCLELLGRSGQEVGLVKVNGQRVEVGEVEAVLKQLPLVRDAAVFLLPPPPTAPQAPLREGFNAAGGGGAATAHSLAAVVVLQEEEEETALDEHAVVALTLGCAAALPRHMVPARFGTMALRVQSTTPSSLVSPPSDMPLPPMAEARDERAEPHRSKRPLPLTGSGKLDYRRLSHLFARAVAARSFKDDSRSASEAKSQILQVQEDLNYSEGDFKDEEEDADAIDLFVRPGELVPPKTSMERAVASAWAIALGLKLDQVGRHDSFVALGGDSLAALRASRLLTSTTTTSAAATNTTATGIAPGSSGVRSLAVKARGISSLAGETSDRDMPGAFPQEVEEKQQRQMEREKEQGMAQGEAALILHRLELQTNQTHNLQNNNSIANASAPSSTREPDGEGENKFNDNNNKGHHSSGMDDEGGSNGGEAACLFGVTMGPLAPCEIDARPVLKEYAQFLASRGVRAIGNGEPEEEIVEMESKGIIGDALECNGGDLGDDEDVNDGAIEEGDKSQSSSAPHSNAVASTQVLRALVAAASHGRLLLLRALLAAGADPSGHEGGESGYGGKFNGSDQTQSSGRVNFFTPLHAAAASTHPRAPEALQVLLEAFAKSSTDGASIESASDLKQGRTLGLDNPQRGSSSLLHAVTATTAAGSTAAHFCAARGDTASLEALLRAGCPLLARDADGQTCLTLAARAGALSAVKAVLAFAANETGAEGLPSAIMESINDDECVHEANDCGVSHDVTGSSSNDGNRNSLGIRISWKIPEDRRESMLSALMERQDRWGRTALAWAVLGGHMCTVDALLEAGADPASSSLLMAGGFGMKAQGMNNDEDYDADGNNDSQGDIDDDGDNPFLKKDEAGTENGSEMELSTLRADSTTDSSSKSNRGLTEEKRFSGRGSGAPAHQARKRASNTDALAELLQALVANNIAGRRKDLRTVHASTHDIGITSANACGRSNGASITQMQALAAAAEAAAAVRTLVCTSNANRTRCRELGGVAALVACLQPLDHDDKGNKNDEEKKPYSPGVCSESVVVGAAFSATFLATPSPSATTATSEATAAPRENIEAAMTSFYVACAGALRNLAYGNEDNRVAIVEAGGVSVLARLVQPQEASNGRSSSSGSSVIATAATSGEKRHLAFVCAGALCNIAMSHASHASILAENRCVAAIEGLFATDQGINSTGISGNGSENNVGVKTTENTHHLKQDNSFTSPSEERTGVNKVAPNASEEAVQPHPGLKRLRAAAATAAVAGKAGTVAPEVKEGAAVSANSLPKSRYGAFRDRKRAQDRETIATLVAAVWAAAALRNSSSAEAEPSVKTTDNMIGAVAGNITSSSNSASASAPPSAPAPESVSANAAASAARALGVAVCGDPRARDAAREEGAIPALVHLLGWAMPSDGEADEDSSSTEVVLTVGGEEREAAKGACFAGVADEVHSAAAGALELVLFGSDANRAEALACGGVPALVSLVKEVDLLNHAVDAAAVDVLPAKTLPSQTSMPATLSTTHHREDASELNSKQSTAVRAAKALCNIAMLPASHPAILAEPQLVDMLTRVLTAAQKLELEAAAAQRAALGDGEKLSPSSETSPKARGAKKSRARKTPPGLHPGLVRLQMTIEENAMRQ